MEAKYVAQTSTHAGPVLREFRSLAALKQWADFNGLKFTATTCQKVKIPFYTAEHADGVPLKPREIEYLLAAASQPIPSPLNPLTEDALFVRLLPREERPTGKLAGGK